MAKKLLKSELNEDYRLMGYFKKDRDTYLTDPTNSSFDQKGDLVKVEYYRNYDESTDTYSDLAVSEERTYYRGADGLLTKRKIVHKWLYNGEIIGEKETIKHYGKNKAYRLQKRASSNLIDRASLYLTNVLIQNNSGDTLIGITKAKQFLDEIDTEINKYIKQNKQPLIDAINNTTNPDITTNIKTVLVNILDISYIQ